MGQLFTPALQSIFNTEYKGGEKMCTNNMIKTGQIMKKYFPQKRLFNLFIYLKKLVTILQYYILSI